MKQLRSKLPNDFPLKNDREAAEKFWRAKQRPELVDTVDMIAEEFRAHHEANDSVFTSWPAAWKTWYVRAVRFSKPRVSLANAREDVPSRRSAMTTRELPDSRPSLWWTLPKELWKPNWDERDIPRRSR